MRFAGKNVVITGGSSGIGLAAAQRVVAEGGRVLVTGTNRDKLAAASASSPEIHSLYHDAADLAGAGVLAEESTRLFGSIDGIFFNAGIARGTPEGGVSIENYRRVMDVNVGGPLFGMQALSPVLRDGGAVVITLSAAWILGPAGVAVYSASKGAGFSLMRSFARELAPRDIRVNAITPGGIRTSFFERAGLTPDMVAQVEKMIAGNNVMGRMASAEEAAAVATFLLSDEASFVTGSDYAVDGGEAQL